MLFRIKRLFAFIYGFIVRRIYPAFFVGSSSLLAFLMFISATDVIGRYLFNRPIIGIFEISEILLVGIVFLGSVYTLHQDKQITMELLYSGLSPKKKRIVDIVTRMLSAMVFILMTWKVTKMGIYCKQVGRQISGLLWPVYPFMFIVSLGSALISLELVAQIIILLTGFKVNLFESKSERSASDLSIDNVKATI